MKHGNYIDMSSHHAAKKQTETLLCLTKLLQNKDFCGIKTHSFHDNT